MVKLGFKSAQQFFQSNFIIWFIAKVESFVFSGLYLYIVEDSDILSPICTPVIPANLVGRFSKIINTYSVSFKYTRRTNNLLYKLPRNYDFKCFMLVWSLNETGLYLLPVLLLHSLERRSDLTTGLHPGIQRSSIREEAMSTYSTLVLYWNYLLGNRWVSLVDLCTGCVLDFLLFSTFLDLPQSMPVRCWVQDPCYMFYIHAVV